jgi:hypothetical protein
MIGDQRLQLIGQRRKPSRQGCRRFGPYLPIGDVDQAVSFSFDQPPAGGAEPGI